LQISIWDPNSFKSSDERALTVAFVATGANSGVSTLPCFNFNKPVLASPSLDFTLNSNRPIINRKI